MINYAKTYLRPAAALVFLLLVAACTPRYGELPSMPASLSQIKLSTSGFNEVQRERLVNRLQDAGSVILDDASASVPTLTVTLGPLLETGFINVGRMDRTVRLLENMSYEVTAPDNTTLKEKRNLRQESLQGVDDFNLAYKESEKLRLQEHLQNIMTTRMIYQLESM